MLHSLGGLLLLVTEPLYARDFYFSPNSLEGGANTSQVTDLSIFSNPKAQMPGKYLSYIRLNQQPVDETQIIYTSGADGALHAQLTPLMLRQWGVKVDDYPEMAALPQDQPFSLPIGHYIPSAQADFDFASQTLKLSLPQRAVRQVSAGYIDPSRWDDGIPVLFSDYAFSVRENHGGDTRSDNSQYLNLRSGMNLGGWQLRNYSTWNNTGEENAWQTIGTWLQHDIQQVKAQFTAGENSTRGEVFDSIQYRGINIISDEEMLPIGERGFAPVIRGVAMSNAQVTVKQNGYVIYQSNVAPGAFEITDLYASTNSGDLEVSVKEADGTEHLFTQPFSSVALMQRPHHLRFETTVGRYRADSGSDDKEPSFFQGSAIYGVNNRLTIYGGTTLAEEYLSGVTGVGVNLGQFGSISADVTMAQAQSLDGETYRGQSWRLLYTSSIEATNTHFTLASYRYSTSGYYSFADANHLNHEDDNDWRDDYNKRNRLQMSISQPFENGSFYINGYQQDYWGTHRKERSITAGSSYQYAGISYHLNLSWNDTQDDDSDRMISFGVSIPLSRWLPDSWVSYNISNTKNGATAQNLGLNGTLLEDRSLSYGLQQSHSNESPQNSSSLYSTWRAPFSNLSGGYYTSSDGSRQYSYGASGAVVIHPHGVTLSQPLGDQFAIIDTDGTAGLQFQNQRGIRTDMWGNAVIPSLTAYQENRIGLDTTQLPNDVDSSDTALIVVPSRNAAVRAHFSARTGYRMLITLTRPEGKAVPFGAMASSADGELNGIVDDNGVLYLSGVSDKTVLTVQWGTAPDDRCSTSIDFISLSDSQQAGPVKMLTALCRPGGLQ